MRKDVYVEGGIRLQKALSQAGVASRRAAETLIAEGRVQVRQQAGRRGVNDERPGGASDFGGPRRRLS